MSLAPNKSNCTIGHHRSHTVIIRQIPIRLSSTRRLQPNQRVQPLHALWPLAHLYTLPPIPERPNLSTETNRTTPPTQPPYFYWFFLPLPSSLLGICSLERPRVCARQFGGFAAIIEAADHFVCGDVCRTPILNGLHSTSDLPILPMVLTNMIAGWR
jgi:hypothetical protein